MSSFAYSLVSGKVKLTFAARKVINWLARFVPSQETIQQPLRSPLRMGNPFANAQPQEEPKILFAQTGEFDATKQPVEWGSEINPEDVTITLIVDGQEQRVKATRVECDTHLEPGIYEAIGQAWYQTSGPVAFRVSVAAQSVQA